MDKYENYLHYLQGYDAGYTRSTAYINNPYNSMPDSDAYESWRAGWVAGDKQRQILTDK